MSKRNENRPGYKKTKVGWIPEEWECVRFGDVVRIGNGQVSPQEQPYCNYLHIGPENIISGTGQLTGLKTAAELRLISGKYFFDNNAIVYSKIRPNLNKVCMPGFLGICSADAYPIWCKDKITIYYLLYYMLSSLFVRQATACSMRTGLPKINRGELKTLSVSLPPLPEQKKIAEILSAWDRAIEQVGKLIDAKERLKKGLMQQLLTGRMRFAEFGKPVRGKGELPEGWKACKLGDCFKERKETNPDLPLLAITSDRGVIPRDEVERKDTSNADKSKYKRIAPGDIGYNTMRMWQGVSAVSTLEGIVSPAYTICTPTKGHSSNFFGYLFKYPPMIHLFHRFSQGLVSDTLNLKFRHFSQVKANVPSEAEQIRIAAVLSTCDREIELLKKKLEKLKEQKKGLMQKLLTGEVRVKI